MSFCNDWPRRVLIFHYSTAAPARWSKRWFFFSFLNATNVLNYSTVIARNNTTGPRVFMRIVREFSKTE